VKERVRLQYLRCEMSHLKWKGSPVVTTPVVHAARLRRSIKKLVATVKTNCEIGAQETTLSIQWTGLSKRFRHYSPRNTRWPVNGLGSGAVEETSRSWLASSFCHKSAFRVLVVAFGLVVITMLLLFP